MRLPVLVALAGCAAPADPRVYLLEDLPITEWTLGLPVHGDGRMIVMLFPNRITDWRRATGFVDFTCDRCTLGDDRSRLGVLDERVEFGHITFDSVHARATFADGRMHLVVHWRSPDMTLDADVTGKLAPAAKDIELDGCVSFGPTDALLARDPRTHAVLSLTGAPLREDHKFTIRIEGTLGTMRKLGKLCDVSG